jgi:hypothetical protein
MLELNLMQGRSNILPIRNNLKFDRQRLLSNLEPKIQSSSRFTTIRFTPISLYVSFGTEFMTQFHVDRLTTSRPSCSLFQLWRRYAAVHESSLEGTRLWYDASHLFVYLKYLGLFIHVAFMCLVLYIFVLHLHTRRRENLKSHYILNR